MCWTLASNNCWLRDYLRSTIMAPTMDQITIKISNPKCRLFLLDLLRDLEAGVYLSEAPSPPRFLFGVVKQFCRFGISPPPPPCYTLYKYKCIPLYFFTQGRGGGSQPVRRLEGASSQLGVETPIWLTVSPIYKLSNTSKDDIKGLVSL
jgi:hypothetical protein